MATRSSLDWNPSPTTRLTGLPPTLNSEPGSTPIKGIEKSGLSTLRYFSTLVTAGKDRTCSATVSGNPGKKTRITFPLLDISSPSSCAREGVALEAWVGAAAGAAPVTAGVVALAAVGLGEDVAVASCVGSSVGLGGGVAVDSCVGSAVDAGAGVGTEVGVSIRAGRSVGVLTEVGGADEQAANTNPTRSRDPSSTPRFITGPLATPGIAVQLKSVCKGLSWNQEKPSGILDLGLYNQGFSAYSDQQPQLPSQLLPLLTDRCLISATWAASTKTSSCWIVPHRLPPQPQPQS